MTRILKIGRVRLGEVPRVVLAVARNHPSLTGASKNGVDLLEARVDQFHPRDPDSVAKEVRALRKLKLPILATVRSKKEGGKAGLSDAQRAALYRKLAPFVDAMDVELSSSKTLRKQVRELARKNKQVLILSYHHFGKTPSAAELKRVVKKAKSEGADIVKIAAFAKSDSDIVRLLEFTAKNQASRLVTISMGAKGSISRLAFPMAGSLLTYTNLKPAHGQIPLKELVRQLRLYYP